MKKLLIILSVFVLAGCASGNYAPGDRGPVGDNIVIPQEDGEEYEIIIMDNGFDRWFQTNARPPDFYSLNYYENKNQMYVTSWNQNVSRFAGYTNSPFENRIDYQANEDYGMEVNYKLFYYFKYIENMFGRRFNFPG